MRLRPHSLLILAISSLAVAAQCSPAGAQIRFAKSTMRITTADEPAPEPDLAEAPESEPRSPEPQIAEPTSHEQERSLLTAPRAPQPARPVAQYPVRQADFVAPARRPLVHPPTTARAPSLVNVYSSTNARATLNKMPRPAPVEPRPAAQPAQTRGKPFQAVQTEPAVSPYLNMYRNDANSGALPSFLTFVRPQLQQQESNRRQAAELQKLRGQVQSMSSARASAPTSAGMPAQSHFMNTAQFYGGLRR